jgi:hypothetical protein
MISQRSVGRLQRLLLLLFKKPAPALRPRPATPIPSGRDETTLDWAEFRTRLYEEDVDRRILDLIENMHLGLPNKFLPALHDGTISAIVNFEGDDFGFGPGPPDDNDREKGQGLLKVFAEVAIRHALDLPNHSPEPRTAAADLLRSLALDGFEWISNRLVPSTLKGMNLEQEDDHLVGLIRSLSPPNLSVIVHHHHEAAETFVNGRWGSASGELRNLFMAVLRGLRDVATSRGHLKAFEHGNDTDLIQDYRTIGMLTQEEKETVLKLWVLLSYSGPHPGIQELDRARLTRLLVLGLLQWVCIKFQAWETNGFKPL